VDPQDKQPEVNEKNYVTQVQKEMTCFAFSLPAKQN
jgi:hypothetical protein